MCNKNNIYICNKNKHHKNMALAIELCFYGEKFYKKKNES